MRPGKIVLLHGINDNIIIPHPYYSGVYEYKAKMRSLQRDKCFFGLEPNKKNFKMVLRVSPSTLGIKLN